MKIKIGKILKQNCINGTINFIPIILLSIILCGQSYAQWERTNLPDTVKVNAIVIRDSSIFAGTNGDGIFVSTNNGENWKSINEGLQSKIIHTILITGKALSARQSPLDSERSLTTGQVRIFAGTETGVSVSTDNGENWKSINSGLSGLGVWSLAISADSAGDTTIFAGTWNGLYSSTDWGEKWEVTGLSSTKMPVHTIIILNGNIFAATLTGGLFISHDNGLTWTNTIIIRTNKNFQEMTAPICSLTKFVGPFSHYIIAGSYGGLYYMNYLFTSFDGDTSLANWSAPILSFADRNDTLYTSQYGYFFWIYHDFFDLNFGRLHIPYLGNRAVYSLALNNAYIFAGTEEGIWRLWYPEPGAITGIKSPQEVPSGFVLEQNYPNPFNPATTINYNIPKAARVTLKVYDILGNAVQTLVNKEQQPGSYNVLFAAGSRRLASGVYFYRLQAGSFVNTKKMILLQ